MEYLFWSALGVIVGSIVTNIIWFIRSASGCLRIDHSNPEKDVYRFEVNDIDSLSKKRQIILKIDNHANLSQK